MHQRRIIDVFFLITSVILLVESSVISQATGNQLLTYRKKASIYFEMLLEECPNKALVWSQLNNRSADGVTSTDENKESALLDDEKEYFKRIEEELIECRQRRNVIRPKTSTSSTIPLNQCSHATGYVSMYIDFVSYHYPTNIKHTVNNCEDDSVCRMYLNICISHIDERDCSIYSINSEIERYGLAYMFQSDIGGSRNPLILKSGNKKWDGVHILLTVLNKDLNLGTSIQFDEFRYDAVGEPGSPSQTVTLNSNKHADSKFKINVRTFCPSPAITTTESTSTTSSNTTTVTTMTTTTQRPIPECVSAINLTDAWRSDAKGSDIKPVNNYYNCDTKAMVQKGRPWFRFSGAAGNRLRDACVRDYSCGTANGLWSSDPMPSNVGVVNPIIVKISGACNPYHNSTMVSVIRCSQNQDDFIYRYDDSSTECSLSFCGMN